MSFLKGKVALITGAGRAVLANGKSGSIGYGIATAYAKEGANLVITGRNTSKLAAAKEELEEQYMAFRSSPSKRTLTARPITGPSSKTLSTKLNRNLVSWMS